MPRFVVKHRQVGRADLIDVIDTKTDECMATLAGGFNAQSWVEERQEWVDTATRAQEYADLWNKENAS